MVSVVLVLERIVSWIWIRQLSSAEASVTRPGKQATDHLGPLVHWKGHYLLVPIGVSLRCLPLETARPWKIVLSH